MAAAKPTVKPRPAENPTRKERQRWCEGNIKQVTEVLFDAGYQAAAIFEAPYTGTFEPHQAASIEMFIGPGKQPVIGVQRYADYAGFEVLVPLTSEQEMGLVVEALKQATARREVR